MDVAPSSKRSSKGLGNNEDSFAGGKIKTAEFFFAGSSKIKMWGEWNKNGDRALETAPVYFNKFYFFY